jgi:multiple sugar transport system permease protein
MKGDSLAVRPSSTSSKKGRGIRSLSLESREAIWFHVFIAPWLLGFLIFVLLPMVASLFFSFTRYNALNPPQWIGFKNFGLLADDPIFWKSMRVTFLYTAISVPLGMVVSLFLAMLLNLRVPGMRAIRTIYYLPSILPAVVTGLVWVWLFSVDFGLLNYILYLLTGLKGPNWLGSERWVMPATIISGLWGIGGGVLILLAALQNVPQELYEAAELDGAGVIARFFNVTLPMISSVVLYNLIIGIIGSLQTFARIYVLTGGGPNYASYFYNLYIYDNAFSYLKLGLASAQAWILFVIIMILTYLALRTSGRWVYYAGGR